MSLGSLQFGNSVNPLVFEGLVFKAHNPGFVSEGDNFKAVSFFEVSNVFKSSGESFLGLDDGFNGGHVQRFNGLGDIVSSAGQSVESQFVKKEVEGVIGRDFNFSVLVFIG